MCDSVSSTTSTTTSSTTCTLGCSSSQESAGTIAQSSSGAETTGVIGALKDFNASAYNNLTNPLPQKNTGKNMIFNC